MASLLLKAFAILLKYNVLGFICAEQPALQVSEERR